MKTLYTLRGREVRGNGLTPLPFTFGAFERQIKYHCLITARRLWKLLTNLKGRRGMALPVSEASREYGSGVERYFD